MRVRIVDYLADFEKRQFQLQEADQLYRRSHWKLQGSFQSVQV